jgi:putative transposase
VLLAKRGVPVTYESIRQWCPAARPKWHLDEVFIRIRKQTCYLWRAVDQDGMALDILVQERRNQEAAERFLRQVVAGEPEKPRVVVTDKLASYRPAIKQVLPHAEHRQHKGLNNRAENSHLPTRQRERRMRRCKSPAQAQRFLEPCGPISDYFCPRRHLLGAAAYRRALAQRFLTWRTITSSAA